MFKLWWHDRDHPGVGTLIARSPLSETQTGAGLHQQIPKQDSVIVGINAEQLEHIIPFPSQVHLNASHQDI